MLLFRLWKRTDNPRCLTYDNAKCRHTFCHNGTSSYNAVMAYRNAFEHYCTATQPHSVFDTHRLHLHIVAIDRMLIGVHDDDIARYLAVGPNINRHRCDYFHATIQISAFTNLNRSTFPALNTYAREKL